MYRLCPNNDQHDGDDEEGKVDDEEEVEVVVGDAADTRQNYGRLQEPTS